MAEPIYKKKSSHRLLCFNLGLLTGSLATVAGLAGLAYGAYKTVLPELALGIEEKLEQGIVDKINTQVNVDNLAMEKIDFRYITYANQNNENTVNFNGEVVKKENQQTYPFKLTANVSQKNYVAIEKLGTKFDASKDLVFNYDLIKLVGIYPVFTDTSTQIKSFTIGDTEVKLDDMNKLADLLADAGSDGEYSEEEIAEALSQLENYSQEEIEDFLRDVWGASEEEIDAILGYLEDYLNNQNNNNDDEEQTL